MCPPTHLGIDHEILAAGGPHRAQAVAGVGGLDAQGRGAGAQGGAQLVKQAGGGRLGVALQGEEEGTGRRGQ